VKDDGGEPIPMGCFPVFLRRLAIRMDASTLLTPAPMKCVYSFQPRSPSCQMRGNKIKCKEPLPELCAIVQKALHKRGRLSPWSGRTLTCGESSLSSYLQPSTAVHGYIFRIKWYCDGLQCRRPCTSLV
jgi:hypothetical protein